MTGCRRTQVLVFSVLAVLASAVLAPAATGTEPAPAEVPAATPDGPVLVDGLVAPDGREYALGGGRWPRLNLTYGFDNYTADLTQADQKGAVEQALDRWAAVSSLVFRRIADCGRPVGHVNCQSPDIRLLFGTGDHSNFMFDFPFFGETAHAYFPPVGFQFDSIAGDVHFNDEELFSTPEGAGFPLLTIALHELGHSLGLDHATGALCAQGPGPNRPIMCPSVYAEQLELAPDDIAGIRALYGSARCDGRAVRTNLNLGQQPTNGNNVILGTPGPDVINGLNGNDVVCGGGSNDVIRGGPGADRLIGGTGTDTCIGGPGADLRFSCEAGS